MAGFLIGLLVCEALLDGQKLFPHHRAQGHKNMTLKVIGAGFGRTATASLKYALETLLGGPCLHMVEVLGKAGQVDLWLDAAAVTPNCDAIFDAGS